MPRALALSPHLDDAAFSCGGTLGLLARNGWDVTVCTAFTRSMPSPSGFALACQLDKGLPPDVDYMALRRVEDMQACKQLGAIALWLDLPEAPHRGYHSAKALFGQPHEDDPVSSQLPGLLTHLLANPPELLLAPQALGGHVDHVLLVDALLAVLPDEQTVWWWTDFPYAARPDSHPACPFDQEMDSLTEIGIEGDADARLKACLSYSTQLGFQFNGPEGLVQTLQKAGSTERFRVQGEAIHGSLNSIS